MIRSIDPSIVEYLGVDLQFARVCGDKRQKIRIQRLFSRAHIIEASSTDYKSRTRTVDYLFFTKSIEA